MGLRVVVLPKQRAGILHSVGGGLTEGENFWQPVGNPISAVNCVALRQERGHWGYHCYFVLGASCVFSFFPNCMK